MTFADFMAMSSDEQRSALDGLASSNADTTAAPESDAAADTSEVGTDMSAEADADADAVGTKATNTEADPSTSDELSSDLEVEAVMTSCAGNDDALVADQMAP